MSNPAPPVSIAVETSLSAKDIYKHCNNYKGGEWLKSALQLVITLLLFVATIGLMFYSITNGFIWIPVILMLPAAGLLTRIFIFQHDCGHGSFFKSRKANDWTGRFLSLLTVTPYSFWRLAHNKHHAASGDLDRRGIGGVDTLTVKEYHLLTPAKKILYRIYRNPIFMLLFGTPFYTIICLRIPITQSVKFIEGYETVPVSSIWSSIILTNIGLALFWSLITILWGATPIIFIYLCILIVTSWIGGWLFYVQHQFENSYWERTEEWNLYDSALQGSSYYALHPVLQWFTGNIGLHHIHHLCLKIPNYKLQQCLEALPELKSISRLTLRESLRCLNFKLWDEEKKKLVTFSSLFKENCK